MPLTISYLRCVIGMRLSKELYYFFCLFVYLFLLFFFGGGVQKCQKHFSEDKVSACCPVSRIILLTVMNVLTLANNKIPPYK